MGSKEWYESNKAHVLEMQKERRSSYDGAKKVCQLHIRRDDFKEFTISDDDWSTHWNTTSCKLCGRELPVGVAKHKHFDHKHGTSVYRGTLCQTCNHSLGYIEKFLDNEEYQNQITHYLK